MITGKNYIGHDLVARGTKSFKTFSPPLNEFNSTSNPTWDGLETVYISEIGIYDSNKNLVAIGKLNDPVAKDATIARTIVFALDF